MKIVMIFLIVSSLLHCLVQYIFLAKKEKKIIVNFFNRESLVSYGRAKNGGFLSTPKK